MDSSDQTVVFGVIVDPALDDAIERADEIPVVIAYSLDAGQKRDYLTRRVRGE
jgi:hypothetical protein